MTVYRVNEEPHGRKAPSVIDKTKEASPASSSFPTNTRPPLNLQVTPGSTCLVFGLGGIGSAIVMACKASGASRIIGVDINEQKFRRARALGVTDCLNPRKLQKPVQDVVMEMTGVGVDFAFEAIGLIETMVCVLSTFREHTNLLKSGVYCHLFYLKSVLQIEPRASSILSLALYVQS